MIVVSVLLPDQYLFDNFTNANQVWKKCTLIGKGNHAWFINKFTSEENVIEHNNNYNNDSKHDEKLQNQDQDRLQILANLVENRHS